MIGRFDRVVQVFIKSGYGFIEFIAGMKCYLFR